MPVNATTFTFTTPIADGGAYNVQVLSHPSGPNQTCTLSTNTGSVSRANVIDVSVVCSTNTYTIGGNITGYTGSGLVLQNNGGDDLIVPVNATTFTFTTPVADGGAYSVTRLVQPSNPPQNCTVASGSGNVIGGNVIGVIVNCVVLPVTWTKVFATADTLFAFNAEDGFVYAWGANWEGELGANLDPAIIPEVAIPTKVCADTACSSYLRAVDVAEFNTSDWFVWMRKTDGTVWGWGLNRNGNFAGYAAAGEWGLGAVYRTPVRMYSDAARTAPLSGILQIANGYQHNIYLDSTGNIRGQGWSLYAVDASNNYYQTPILSKSGTAFPGGISKIFSVPASSYAVDGNGDVWAWGRTDNMGDNNYTRNLNTCAPVYASSVCFNQVRVCSPNDTAPLNNACTSFLNGAVAISGSGSTTQALMGDGSVYSWGWAGSGEHGAGALVGTLYKPVKMLLANPAVALVPNSLGNSIHTLVVDSTGTLYASGGNGGGQLGNGTTVASNLPVQVCGDTLCTPFKMNLTAIASGNKNLFARGRDWSAAIKEDGTLWVWGDDIGDGIFGNGVFNVQSGYPQR